MKRFVATAGFVLAMVSQAAAWPLSFGDASGNRVAAGKGTFPRWQALSIATDAPLRWIVAFPPRRLAAVDRAGAFWIFEITPAGLRVAARYGDAASPEGAPAVVRLDQDRAGVALVAPDGRLLIWSEGVLRAYEVGSPLSRLTFPMPAALGGKQSHDLLAVAQDGAVVMIGGLAAGGPRVVARLDVHALPDARITLGDLDGDGTPEAVVLSDPTDRYAHGVLGDRLEAASLTVIGLRSYALDLRGRFTLPPPAVFEDLVPILAPIDASAKPAVLLARSAPGEGGAVVALGWRDGALIPVAEGPGFGQSHRWTHLIGAADVSGDHAPEIIAVATPHLGGALTVFRRVGASLSRVARAAGYSSHAIGSRNLDQALIADLDGDGITEVVVPRQSRDALAGLQLLGDHLVERWSVDLRSGIQSNLAATDLDGDGLLDLAVADRRALRVFLSVRREP